MRLRTGLKVWWRADGVCQVGADQRSAVVLDGLRPAEFDLCERLRRPVRSRDIDRIGQSLGLPRGAGDRLAARLRAAAALLKDDADGCEPDHEDAYWELAARLGPSTAIRPVLAGRGACSVGVVGADRLGIAMSRLLGAAGVGGLFLADDTPVLHSDVGPGAFRPPDRGAARSLAGAALLQREHPHLIVDAPGEFRPDVVVLNEHGVALPSRSTTLLREDVPHLSIVQRELDVVVGPLVVPGRTPCLRCVDLHRTDEDARWPALATQFTLEPPGRTERVTAHAAAALAAREVLAWLDGREVSTIAHTWEVDPSEPVPRGRAWAAHPRCGCAAQAITG